MSIREEFYITRQGKQYVLYAGLLDEAHERGLKGIDTALVQRPEESNENVAIVQAHVHMEAGTYSGIGDASAENVSRNIVPHLIRMAETRAKARALRDAVNIGATSLEELGEDNPEEAPQSPQNQSSQGSGASEKTGGGASKRSVMKLRNTVPKGALSSLEAKHGEVETWSQQAVSRVIARFKEGEASG